MVGWIVLFILASYAKGDKSTILEGVNPKGERKPNLYNFSPTKLKDPVTAID